MTYNRQQVNPFPGGGLDNFSISNTVLSTGLRTFVPGMTLAFTFFCTKYLQGLALYENMFGCWTAAASKGWRMINQDGGVYFQCPGVSAALLQGGGLTSGRPFTKGLWRCVLTWNASNNHLQCSINGAANIDLGVVATGNVPDGTSRTALGRDSHTDGYYTALTSGSLCSIAILNRELTATEAQNISTIPLTVSRFSFIPTLINNNPATVFDFDGLRDWNGVAGTFTTLGISPITFTVSGSVNQENYTETRIICTDDMYWDGKWNTTVDTNYTLRNPFNRLKANISQNSFAVDALYNSTGPYPTGNYPSNGYNSCAAYLNGVFSSQVQIPSPVDTLQVCDFSFTASPNQQMEVITGNRVSTVGEVIYALRLRTGDMLIEPVIPQKRLVIFGDSISIGYFATILPQQASIPLLRAAYPNDPTRAVTSLATGGATLYQWTLDAPTLANTIALLQSELNGSSLNILYIQIGINDATGGPYTSSQFQTAYAALVDGMHAAMPNLKIVCQSMFQIVGAPSTAAAFRTAVQTVANARSSYCTFEDGTTILPDSDFYSDNEHLKTNGNAGWETFLNTTIVSLGW